ncbi:hypothetical protein L596_014884 [Steinernema carpocapsae]|uniref:Serine/threonine-protein phosphatase 4 regulatory subunit 2 n=1 Tax=Steinernema carpocapsae TaxID=34508 RepID=A0A4U5NE34_STECR|nr:hypothetical protein L596_014884 [Steinernema carpocapsae]
MVVEANGSQKSDEMLAGFRTVLAEFQVPDESTLTKDNEGFYVNPNKVVDRYFMHVAEIGCALLSWDVIRPAFLWKLKIVMKGMEQHEHQLSMLGKAGDCVEPFEEKESDKESREFIENKAEEFDGIPFTIQRLCELLSTPSRHYHSADKFFRALEKNINVVGTVTETGERITGTDPEEMDVDVDDSANSSGYVEQKFFIRVDELDEPVPETPKSPFSSDDT